MSRDSYADTDQLLRQVEILRARMLLVHYHEESHWLAAAVAFPHLCQSALAQDALRRAATIAWQFGFPALCHWLNTELLANGSMRTADEIACPAVKFASCLAPDPA
jgi:hypothetical protein